MKFEEQLLALPIVKDVKEVKLLKHAHKAAQAPDTGITIKVKSAYTVIGDCAAIAVKYIPLFVYSQIESPIVKLQNSFTRTQINEFVIRSINEPHTLQLLKCLLYDIDTYINNRPINAPKLTQFAPLESNTVGSSSDDVYGDYDRIDKNKPMVLQAESIEDKIIRVLNITTP